MATGLESEAVFSARCGQLGFTEAQRDAIAAAGFGTLGSFAFSSSFQPGQPDEAPLLRTFNTIFPPGPDQALVGRLRRLYYEAHTLALSDMRNRIERTEDDKPRKLQVPERAARTLQQRNRLRGLNLKGELEPSYSLIDRVVDQVENSELRYIAIEDLTSREMEMRGEKKDPRMAKLFRENKQGLLQREQESAPIVADASTDLQLRNCLSRRGVAYDQAGLITWEVHERWISILYARMAEPPPPGRNWVGTWQILQADIKIWIRMAEDCLEGITAPPGGPRPLDVAMTKFMDHADITNLLQPLPSGGKGNAAKGPYARPQTSRKGDRNTQDEGKGKGDRKGGKGRGKGRGGKKGQPFIKCLAVTSDGRHICFGFNSANGCFENVVDGKCRRGWHICGRAPCHGQHSMQQCIAAGA